MDSARLDEYDYLLRDAATDSHERFLRLLGPLRQYLERPDVYNVNVNEGEEGRIFVECASGKFEAPETMSRADREALIGNIAGKTYATVDRLHARLAADMPHGFDVRVQAFCPPVADWPIMFRPHASEVIGLSRQTINFNPGRTRVKPPCSARGIDAIRASVARGEMIGIVGEPGSGKTTLMSGILEHAAIIRPDARLVVTEDRSEIKPSHRDRIKLLAEIEQKRYDGTPYEYTFEHALKDAVRTGFNIVVIGELRSGPAAVAMVQAFNTGSRGGVGTWHASSALGGLLKLEYLLRIGGMPPIREMIVEAVDLIIFVYEKQIADIQRVMGVDAAGDYILESVV